MVLFSGFFGKETIRKVLVNLEPKTSKLIRSLTKVFCMDTIYSIRKLLMKGCFLASISLRDAYLHVTIVVATQSFLRLAISSEGTISHRSSEPYLSRCPQP